jgi:hypothetical protein
MGENAVEEKAMIDNIVNMMSGQYDMTDFMSEIMENINKITQEKFLNGIMETFSKYKEQSLKESDKEINLLKAMQPFMPEDSRNQINNFTNLLGEVRAINHFMNDIHQHSIQKQEYQKKEQEQKKNSKKEDRLNTYDDSLIIEENTVYEIDKECQGRVKSTGASSSMNLLPLLLILLFGNLFS